MSPKPLIVIDTRIIGGPGRGIIQLARYLSNKRVAYLVCTFAYHNQKSYEFENELKGLKLSSVAVPQRAFLDPSPIARLCTLVKREGYNIIQSHGYKSHLVALAVSRLTGARWVAFAHGWTNENLKVALYHSLDSWSLRLADSVIAVSPQLYSKVLSLRRHHQGVYLVPNAVDPSAISGAIGGKQLREHLGIGESEILLGCFGRLSYEKGQDILLRAISNLVQTGVRPYLVFVGSGPDDRRLRKFVEDSGLTSQVIFEAHTSTLRDYYEAIDLLVLPSRSEGLPNVLLEAASFRVPVVAADVGAVGQVITGSADGWIVPPNNEQSLAVAIAEAVRNPQLRRTFAEAAKKRVSEQFGASARAERICEIYGELLS